MKSLENGYKLDKRKHGSREINKKSNGSKHTCNKYEIKTGKKYDDDDDE